MLVKICLSGGRSLVSHKSTLIKGTFLLTFAGFFCRLLGFFYRIFLSHTFGEEGVGLYQLIFPVFSFCFALTSSGLETAISRSVAQKYAQGKKQDAAYALQVGLIIGFSLSLCCLFVLQKHASYIATKLLHDTRCTPLIELLSYAIPFASIHSCMIGYCYGIKNAKVPAVSQIIDPIVRICTVFFLCSLCTKNSIHPPILFTVLGLIVGEISSSLLAFYQLSHSSSHFQTLPSFCNIWTQLKELLPLSFPLTLNRIILSFLTTVEGVSIPSRLQLYGYSVKDSLSLYGVLTGMALPCILFPSAITNSLSALLMPEVASCQAKKNLKKLHTLIVRSFCSCFLLGLGCCLFFLLLGPFIGSFLFKSETAGKFILTLAWICPFLYLNTTLLSILNGLGKVSITFLINSLSLVIRILAVFIGIPCTGMKGYLHGLLISQLFITILACIFLFSSFTRKTKPL